MERLESLAEKCNDAQRQMAKVEKGRVKDGRSEGQKTHLLAEACLPHWPCRMGMGCSPPLCSGCTQLASALGLLGSPVSQHGLLFLWRQCLSSTGQGRLKLCAAQADLTPSLAQMLGLQLCRASAFPPCGRSSPLLREERAGGLVC